MIIANIVCTTKINITDEFNVVSSINDIIEGLPTLIIGYDYVNKNYPDFDITNISLGNNLYWTFKRTEKRDKYEEDLNWFMFKVYKDLLGKTIYVYVDPINYPKKTLIKVIRKLYSLIKPISYLHDQMVYIYADNIIFGIDLKMLRFIGFNTTKLIDKIKLKSSVFLEKNQILIEYKKNVEVLSNKVRYVPYLYYLRNEKNDITSLIHISRETPMVP
jgi:hypothetical protein